jgi:hypothetical protein
MINIVLDDEPKIFFYFLFILATRLLFLTNQIQINPRIMTTTPINGLDGRVVIPIIITMMVMQ